MSSGDDKARLYLCSSGKWTEGADGWDYVEATVRKGVRMKLNSTFKHVLNYCSWKCEIDRSSGQLHLYYKYEGQMYELTDDEDVSVFLQFAKGSEDPPVLYVDVYVSGEGDGAGTSNTINEEPMYLDTESQIQQSHETSYRADFGYGLSDSYPEVVLETQQDQQQEVQEEEEEDEDEDEDERRKFFGCAEDESHVLNTGLSDEEDEENEEGMEPSRLRPGLDDYFGIPPLIPTPDFSTEDNEGVPYRRSQRLSIGKVFDTKEKLILETKKSCTRRYEIACARDHCKWSMKAKAAGGGGMFMVTDLVDVHKCSRTQLNPNHRQANQRLLGNFFKTKFRNSRRVLMPKDMAEDFREQYGVTIPYATAWRARWKAITLIRGSHAESFTRLPMYLYNLERANPGTITSIRTDSSGRFAECFVALGVAIHTFLQNLRPVLIIDAAHLKGEYLGTMFLVVAMDGNNNIVPVALGVGRSETADEWIWFLNKLKTCIGEPRELVFMSDRAASINAAITAIFPNAHHALCCRHLVMNVRSRAPRIKQFKTPYWKACKAYTTRVFNRMMNILQVVVPEGAQLMQEVGVERWSRAHFPAQRFNIMTSNSAESINALSRNARKLPIVGLMEYFREFQQEWYFIRRREGEELNHQLTEWAQKKIHKRIVKSATWTAHGIGYDKWEVRDYGYNAEVDMRHRNCTCLKWQVYGLSCGHAITVAKRLGKNDVFYLITQPYYMTELYKATYHGVIKPVGPAETWHYPQNPLPTVLPLLIIKRPVGRPKGNKRRPSRGESRSQQKCPRCEEYGHISSQCPWIPNSARGSSQLEPIGTALFEYKEGFQIERNEGFQTFFEKEGFQIERNEGFQTFFENEGLLMRKNVSVGFFMRSSYQTDTKKTVDFNPNWMRYTTKLCDQTDQ
ncbi:hypothetical protein OSB04_029149 [Centaurea solstitialis]|uniref:Zinc finger PMZ-type domain-containing protein n=1 Tax=Centaurea solstitialis TaxID=347529 RepID=A0AA38SPL3_9ASTR|nr:hypothetical protein OSB04_029149 [Centaurea solstitialis]